MSGLLARRSLAFALDCLLLLLVLWPTGKLVFHLLGYVPDERQVYRILLLNFSLPVWAYFTIADSSRRGATLGMHDVLCSKNCTRTNLGKPYRATRRVDG